MYRAVLGLSESGGSIRTPLREETEETHINSSAAIAYKCQSLYQHDLHIPLCPSVEIPPGAPVMRPTTLEETLTLDVEGRSRAPGQAFLIVP